MFEDLKNISTTNPWEERQAGGFIKAFVQTIYLVAFKPAVFFGNLKIGDSFLSPFLFFFLSSLLTFLVSLPLMLSFPQAPMPGPMAFGLVVFNFVVSVVIVFVSAGFMHLVVKLFGGQAGYRATFNVVAYGSAVSLLTAIPFAGTVIVFVWGAIICIVGIKHVHQLNTTRAALAYFALPLLVILVTAFFTFNARGVCPVSRDRFPHQPVQGQPMPLPPR